MIKRISLVIFHILNVKTIIKYRDYQTNGYNSNLSRSALFSRSNISSNFLENEDITILSIIARSDIPHVHNSFFDGIVRSLFISCHRRGDISKTKAQIITIIITLTLVK